MTDDKRSQSGHDVDGLSRTMAGDGGNHGAAVEKLRALLRAEHGETVYDSWFKSLALDHVAADHVRLSVPVKFLRNWLMAHYTDDLLRACRKVFPGIERVDIVWRQPSPAQSPRSGTDSSKPSTQSPPAIAVDGAARMQRLPAAEVARANTVAPLVRTSVNGMEGSPLDAYHTFDTFVVGTSNRFTHAAAVQVAETALADERSFNPLFIHAKVGLGKSHLLQAIAWEVKRRNINANVLYITAERFLQDFVQAIRTQSASTFKDRLRSVDLLAMDDFEFMQGEKTEQEFEHIINALLDSGRQLVVASARPPAQIERLSDRMRSRLQRGLVTELTALDYELRLKILERHLKARRSQEPLFEISPDILALLAERLTENGRELEGAVNRLFAMWRLLRSPVTMDAAEAITSDMMQGIEPRRIKIEDILRLVSRHFAVSRADILSQRRHRSVVWPRQIGMYLAKQLTTRSLPEIGRRFGDRDHTTVIHAIRKVDKELDGNNKLREELESLKRQLNRPDFSFGDQA